MTIKKPESFADRFEINTELVNKVWNDLKDNVIHPLPCECPSCQYQWYRKKNRNRGRKFDKESFFLEWLESQIRQSKIGTKQDWEYVEDYYERKPGDPSIVEIFLFRVMDYFYVRGLYSSISEFIRNNIPESGINSKVQRIKLKIWRLRKSGILNEIWSEIDSEWHKEKPNAFKKEEQKILWASLKLAQKVADYINSRPQKKSSQRQLLRRFSNKKVEDFEDIREILRLHGIKIEKKTGYRNKQTFYQIQ